jgi:hypothetical protein
VAKEDPFETEQEIPPVDPWNAHSRNLEKAFADFGYKCAVFFDSDNQLNLTFDIPQVDSWYGANLSDGRVHFALLPPKRSDG